MKTSLIVASIVTVTIFTTATVATIKHKQRIQDEYSEFKLIEDNWRQERDEALAYERQLQGIVDPAKMTALSTSCEGCQGKAKNINDTIITPHNDAFEKYTELKKQLHDLEDEQVEARNEAARQFARDSDKVESDYNDGKAHDLKVPLSPEMKALDEEIKAIFEKIHAIAHGPLHEVMEQMKKYKAELIPLTADLKACEGNNDTCHPVMEVETKASFKMCRDGKCWDL